MTPEEFKKHCNMIDESVAFIEEKLEANWNRYEEIEECVTNECNKEKLFL